MSVGLESLESSLFSETVVSESLFYGLLLSRHFANAVSSAPPRALR